MFYLTMPLNPSGWPVDSCDRLLSFSDVDWRQDENRQLLFSGSALPIGLRYRIPVRSRVPALHGSSALYHATGRDS